MCRACSSSTVRTTAPLYGCMVTRPAPARVLSASRTGVLETPSTLARSVSTSARPGFSSPARIACLIASSTATVRDGNAPAAAVRNGDAGTAAVWATEVAELAGPAGPAGPAGWDASGVIIVYG